MALIAFLGVLVNWFRVGADSFHRPAGWRESLAMAWLVVMLPVFLWTGLSLLLVMGALSILLKIDHAWRRRAAMVQPRSRSIRRR